MPLIALWAAALIAFAIALPATYRLEDSRMSSPGPETIVVGQRESANSTAVTLLLKVGDPSFIRSPVGGTVTAVLVPLGETVTQGMPLFEIDYSPVLAFVETSPLVRDVGIGDVGPDVGLLTDFLVHTGHLDPADASSEVTRPVELAIESYQSATTRPVDGVFRTQYVAFVPPGMSRVDRAMAQVGESVSVGTHVFTIDGQVLDVQFEAKNPGALANLANEKLTLHIGDRDVPLSGLHPTPLELAELSAAMTAEVELGLVTVTPASGESPATVTGAVISLLEPRTIATVPGQAVYVAASGAVCIFVREGPGGGLMSRKLDAEAPPTGELGLVEAPRDLVGATIIADPYSLTPPDLALCR